jgi:RNA polymerase sigma-70 factor (ECF subfamily)
VSLYDTLMTIRPSPVVTLNRAIALRPQDGPESGLAELRAIVDSERLAKYPFYHAALCEAELQIGRLEAAKERFGIVLGSSPKSDGAPVLHAAHSGLRR